MQRDKESQEALESLLNGEENRGKVVDQAHIEKNYTSKGDSFIDIVVRCGDNWKSAYNVYQDPSSATIMQHEGKRKMADRMWYVLGDYGLPLAIYEQDFFPQ